MNCTRRTRRFGGFSLLELIVVAGVLSIVSVVVVQIFFSTMRTNAKNERIQDVKANGDNALDIMTRLIQNAQEIVVDAGVCSDATPTPLSSLLIRNTDDGTTTLGCQVSENAARIASASANQSVYLTSPNVTLSSDNTCGSNALSFYCVSTGDVPAYISIEFVLQQNRGLSTIENSASQEFKATVALRNR